MIIIEWEETLTSLQRSIREVAIEQHSWPEALSGGEQLVSFIDSQHQLHLLCLRGKQAYASFIGKIFREFSPDFGVIPVIHNQKTNQLKNAESQVLSTMWSESSRQLAAMREQQILLWECPWAFNIAPKLLDSCRHSFPLATIGPAGIIEYFTGSLLAIRFSNGVKHLQVIPPFSEKIEKAVGEGEWEAALKVARLFDVSLRKWKNDFGVDISWWKHFDKMIFFQIFEDEWNVVYPRLHSVIGKTVEDLSRRLHCARTGGPQRAYHIYKTRIWIIQETSVSQYASG